MISLPGYTFTAVVHEGISTLILRGRRDADGVPIVAKLLRSEYPRPRELARLRHEYSLLRELNLPGVVKAYALERHSNGFALILADLSAQPLSDHIHSGALDVQTSLRIALSLAEILVSLYQHRTIHRDVKPQNILIEEGTGKVILIDFGVASRLSQETQKTTPAHALEGTLAYMSPEQTGRMNRVIDHRTDFYSLGVTLYEMLLGALPFVSTDPVELVHQHIAVTPVPPLERKPTIPKQVSDLVMKLLAKAAEDRYQSPLGIVADLKECLLQLQLKGTIDAFPLGRYDLSDLLQVPQKLYGRQPQIEALLAAFERTSAGRSELFLVGGPAGIGKSVLIHEVNPAIARRGGDFVSGKFDQLHRTLPFAAFTQAFRELVRHLLTQPAAELAAWRAKILDAVTPNAQLLIDLIPELELVLGPQPAVAELGPTESQIRFGRAIQNFLRVFCTSRHPVVLFLDDLQWADPASLWLLNLLLTDIESGHLLIVGAYRDNEVDAAHPLRTALTELGKRDIAPTEVTLEPLKLYDVQQLLAETVGQHTTGDVSALSAQVFRKTHGNPFFLIQFLHALHKAGLLYLDTDAAKWTWDPARIEAAPLTDNVVTFMSGRIQKLPAETQRLLALAACIGFQFELPTLVNISGMQPTEIAVALWPALHEGLLVPLSADYRLLAGPYALDASPILAEDDIKVSYRFLHDRVQQAAYSLIPPAQRPELHLRIGRSWRENLPSAPRAEALFDVVHHLNAGAEHITEHAERIDLARLNLFAGRTAKTATAYAAAAEFFKSGIARLPENAWETEYELCFELHLGHAECDYLAGHFEKANAQLENLLGHVKSDLSRTEILGLRMSLYASQGRFAEGVAAGRAGLLLLGVALPETPEEYMSVLLEQIAEIDRVLATRPIKSLIDAPLMTEKDRQAALRLMIDLSPLAYQLSAPLFTIVVAKQVLFSLTYGHFSLSPYGYVTYGMILAGGFGRYARGIEFGRLALELVEKLHPTAVACKVNSVFGFYSPYGEPLRESVAPCARAQQLGMESGDYYYASLSFIYLPLALLRLGDPLDTVVEEIARGLLVMQRTQDETATAALRLMRQYIACLQGQTPNRTSLDSADFHEAAWLARIRELKIAGIECLYQSIRVQLAYMHENYAQALAVSADAERSMGNAQGLHYSTDVPFYLGLALAGEYGNAAEEKQPEIKANLLRHLEMLTRLREGSPTNENHRHALLSAELARISFEKTVAAELYEKAIAFANENGFPHHEALAHELYAKFLLTSGDAKSAAPHMAKARFGYERWGASAKVAQLSEKYAELFPELELKPVPRESSGKIIGTSTTLWMSGQSLDVVSVLRASQAISSEIVLDKVLDRVMHVVLANAGAQRGFLVLEKNGTLWVEALIAVDPERVEVGIHTPIEERTDLAASLIHYVARSHETVVLGDAAQATRFAADSYIKSQRPKSVLCLALLHQGRLAGVLYLENNVSTNVFTHERVELLRLISSQAAISVENAELYANLHEATEKLRQINESLEQQVAQRTEQLTKALAELWSEMDLARKIQTVLLPTDAKIPGYELTAIMRPAATVGGDYYDIFHEAGTDWLLIGDVSGHGVSAGLCMMMVQTAVRAVARTLQRQPNALRPADVLMLVNSAIHRNLSQIGRDHYMTISAFCFRDNRIHYAGLHQDILIYRAQKRSIERLETRGVWLGVLPNVDGMLYEDHLELAPDDVMLLFTDGVTEASTGRRQYLQTQGLQSFFADIVQSAKSTAEIVDSILDRLKIYTIKDDITVIAIKRLRNSDAHA